jgi:hypothetical protein
MLFSAAFLPFLQLGLTHPLLGLHLGHLDLAGLIDLCGSVLEGLIAGSGV